MVYYHVQDTVAINILDFIPSKRTIASFPVGFAFVGDWWASVFRAALPPTYKRSVGAVLAGW